MSKPYKQARADFEALELIVELDDQVELDSDRLALMQNPTKAQASEMYQAGIRLWFQEHGRHREEIARVGCAATIKTIAKRWGIDL